MESRRTINNANDNKSVLTIYHLNVQSLSNKIDNLEDVLGSEDIDILCLTEHWLQNRSVNDLKIEGYFLTSNFSRSKNKHGGSLILVKNVYRDSIKSCGVAEDSSVELHSEICSIGVNDVCIICCYRPPSGDVNLFFNSLNACFAKALRGFKYVVFTGDLNIDLFSESFNKKTLNDIFDSFNLKVTTHEPTRVFQHMNGHRGESAIDYMVTNIANDLFHSSVVNPHLSDHFALKFVLKCDFLSHAQDEESKLISIRNLSPSSIESFASMVKRQDWDYIYESGTSSDLAWVNFISTLTYFLDCCCPYKNIKISTINHKNQLDNWYNDNLRTIKAELDRLHFVQKHVTNNNLTLQYKNLQKFYRHQIKITKKEYYHNKITNSINKTKAVWNIVNNKLNRRNAINKIHLNINNTIVTDSITIANEFANHFSSVSTNKLNDKYGHLHTSNNPISTPLLSNSIFIDPVTMDEVISVIGNLKNKNSSGTDDINVKIIKVIKFDIAVPLTILINESIFSGVFPTILKTANVIPIHKKNDKHNIENYRQISILSVFSKILEKIVYEKLLCFINKYNIINDCQHGFRPGRSVETANFRFLNFIYSNLDQGKYVVSLFFDLSIAFDTVNREILISKLHNMGIRGQISEWINSYLSNRKMYVRYDGVSSEVKTVNMGVPQGSVLGPLLFLLYANDLPLNISTGLVTMYADDTSVVVASDTLEGLSDGIRSVCVDMERWCRTNHLILNVQKTEYMNMFIKKPLPSTFETHQNIVFSANAKFLGTVIEPNLKFYKHIEFVCSKLNSAFFAILSLKNTLGEAGLLSVYFSLAYSHLSNNIISWGNHPMWDRAFIAQKRIIRLIFDLKPRASCRPIFINKKILTLPCVFIFKCVMFVNSNKHLFEKIGSYSAYNTRGNGLLSVPRHKTAFFEDSPFYSCLSIYNKLSPSIRAMCGKRFEFAVRKFLTTRAFYSVAEYLRE